MKHKRMTKSLVQQRTSSTIICLFKSNRRPFYYLLRYCLILLVQEAAKFTCSSSPIPYLPFDVYVRLSESSAECNVV